MCLCNLAGQRAILQKDRKQQKTKAQAQEIVNAAIITYNNNLTDDTLPDRPAIVQGDITLE